MQSYVHRLNILRFQGMLTREQDEQTRQTLRELLDEENLRLLKTTSGEQQGNGSA